MGEMIGVVSEKGKVVFARFRDETSEFLRGSLGASRTHCPFDSRVGSEVEALR